MTAVEMWSSVLSIRVNRQQGRVMHDTDSLSQQQGRVRQRRAKTGRVRQREGGR